MVNHFLSLLFLILVPSLLAADPIVESSIDLFHNYANYPLTGTVTITHERSEKIDDSSFQFEGKPIDAVIVKEVPFSSQNTLVTIYNFQLPAQAAGSYTLPPVSVKINGIPYQSNASPYEIKANPSGIFSPSPSTSTNRESKTSTPIIFQLDSIVQGPSNLHPGERTKLFYRISFNRSIDLSKSDLPFVHPEHFKKIGDVQIKEYQQGGLSIQELTQEIEAAEIGSFALGPSKIEGYVYTLNSAGEKVYSPTLLQAESSAITIQVTPFPKNQQPASFTEAFGTIDIEDELLSSSQASVGETLQLRIIVKGISNLNSFRLPLLACQPGFSGFFQMNDLPPVGEVDEKNQVKSFQVELRPMTTLATTIPSIEVSSYDQENNQYVIKTTKPIPIRIADAAGKNEQPPGHELPIFPSSHSFQWPEPQLTPLKLSESEPIEIGPNLSWINTCRVFWGFPFAALILSLQVWVKKNRLTRPKPKSLKSVEMFKAASQHFPDPHHNIQLLENAFWLRLYEKELIVEGACHLEELPREGKIGEIRNFLGYLQSLQYGQKQPFDLTLVLKQAQDFFW